MVKRIFVSKCRFPGCGKEIKTGSNMCTKHARMLHDARQRKCNQGKPLSELVAYASMHLGKHGNFNRKEIVLVGACSPVA